MFTFHPESRSFGEKGGSERWMIVCLYLSLAEVKRQVVGERLTRCVLVPWAGP